MTDTQVNQREGHGHLHCNTVHFDDGRSVNQHLIVPNLNVILTLWKQTVE